MAHFILTTVFTSGDVLPFLRVGRRLRARGHAVTLVTHAHYRAAAHEYELTLAPLDDVDDFDRLIDDSALFNSPGGIRELYLRHVLPTVSREYAAIRRSHAAAGAQGDAGETVIVARCAPAIAARMAAVDLGVPLVLAYLAPSNVTTAPLLDELVTRVLRPHVAETMAAMGTHADRYFPRWTDAVATSIGLWPDWFGRLEPAAQAPSVTPTGFVLGDEAVDAAASVAVDSDAVIVTPGTGAFFDASFVDVSVQACARLRRPAVIVTRHERLVPRPLPPGVSWQRYLPFHAALPRAAAIVHHGGIGTAAEALAAGLPQLVMGTGGDRRDNAGRLEQLGVAEYLPPARWSADDVHRALAPLLTDDVRRRCDDARRLVGSDGSGAAARSCEQLLAANGGAAPARATTDRESHDVAARSNPRGTAPSIERMQALSPQRRSLLEQRLRERALGSRT
jgi:rhamnosyltransferase subunit B